MRAPFRTPAGHLATRIALASVLACVAGRPVAAMVAPGDEADDAATQPDRVIAIPPFAIDGKLPAAARDEVQARLVEGVERAGFGVVPPAAVSEAVGDTACETHGCNADLGKKTAATHVLQVWIEQDGRDYLVRMVLSNTRDGSEVATIAHTCDICGVVELGDLIADQSASLRDKLVIVPATIIVETKPEGALVRVDGEVVGMSPLREVVRPGEHVVQIEKRGFHPRRRELTLVEGDEERLRYELHAVEAPDAAPSQTRDLTKPLGWASFGVGLGLLGGAVPLLVLNGRPVKNRCDGENIDVNGLCRYRYRTMVPGAVLAGVGGAMVITGVVLVAMHAKRKGRSDGERKRARLLIGPTDVGVAVDF